MSQSFENRIYGKSAGLHNNGHCNAEGYSEESGDPEIDPFAEHYGRLTRKLR